METHHVGWNGSLANKAHVCYRPRQICTGPTIQGETDDFHKLGHDGTTTGLAATLTWNASDPTTETLVLSLYRIASCGEGCQEVELLVREAGASPVELNHTGTLARSNQTLGLGVRTPDPAPGPLFAQLHTAQSFTVTGTVTVQPS